MLRARGGFQNRLGELDRILVVMIEEIDHHAAPAEFFKGAERFLHSTPQGRLVHPGPEPHLLRFRIAANLLQVEAIARPGHVGVRSRFDARLRLLVPRCDRSLG